MKRFGMILIAGWLMLAQKADYIILVETSHLTCGRPTEEVKKALDNLLCSGSYGNVAIGTFYRKGGGGYVEWKTTPVLTGSGTPCRTTLRNIRSRCDSSYIVHLLGAVEQAARGDFVQAPEVIVIASGADATPGLKDADILRLTRSNNVRIHALSVGYSANDDRAQNLLKRISGQFEEAVYKGRYDVADPQSPLMAETIRDFLSDCLSSSSSAASAPAANLPAPSTTVSPIETVAEPPQSEGTSLTKWLLIAAVGLVAVGLVIVLLSRSSKSSAPPPPPPGPVIQSPPFPALRKLIIHYPHGTQEIQLSASGAPISLGRAPDNTVVISDPTVSSRHARLYLQGNQWYIQDLGSTNGTFVNNTRTTQYPVRIGDQIRLGAIVIQVAS